MWRRWIFICGDVLTIIGNEAEDGACDGRLELFAREEKVRREIAGMGDGDVERGWTGGGGGGVAQPWKCATNPAVPSLQLVDGMVG